jgi:pimeloyl-ACP methyl ester carboxylesterase
MLSRTRMSWLRTFVARIVAFVHGVLFRLLGREEPRAPALPHAVKAAPVEAAPVEAAPVEAAPLEAVGADLTTSARMLAVHGTHVYFEDVGRGRPLVLLHGLSDSHRTWRRVVPLLARTRRVLTPDLPGCGLSGRPDASYSLDWQAHVMAAWLDALALGEVDVVGHSYGGGVAQYMLLVAPQHIRRLVLVASGGLGRAVMPALRLASLPSVVERFGQPFMAPLASRVLRAVGGLVSDDDEPWLREVNGRPGTARAFARTVRDVIDWRGQRRHFADRASEITRLPPTALFWGRRDRVIPYAQARTSEAMLRGATLVTFEHAGHFPHHQYPERFAAELVAFFDATDAVSVRYERPEPRTATNVLRALRASVRALLPRPVRARLEGQRLPLGGGAEEARVERERRGT